MATAGKPHFTLFDPDANYNFVGRRHVYYALTGIGIIASFVALATLGFNKGIDFKGGTKQILAFKPDAKVDRQSLHMTVEKVLHEAIGQKLGGQIEVQEFDTGGAGGGAKHFAVMTEVTSLVDAEKKAALGKAIRAALDGKAAAGGNVAAAAGGNVAAAAGGNVEVEWAAEGEDRAFITVVEPRNVADTYAALVKSFKDNGFPTVHPGSDVEVQLDVNLFRQLQMSQAEGAKDAAVLATEEATLRAQKALELKGKSDTRFTVVIEEFKAKLEGGIKAQHGAAFVGIVSATAVSPSVAGEMLSQGLVAILYAILGIVLYIILRFDVRYAPGALVALVHDVVLVIGAFSVAQVKFSMPIIAAVLTVAGYSVTDTIVVFDRIRETQERFPHVPIETIVNGSINATMSRTVLTSLTTFLTSASIFVFGGGLIRDFAFAMCIGVIVGTFSSIFVASPIFIWLHHRFEDQKKAAKAAARATVAPTAPAGA
ncbi:MAG: protein translocase subunit SecF [Myxococcales bacterium]|nr:protein translocase subunit SecF [Myxococcales bacterium]